MKRNLNIQLMTAAILAIGGLVMLFCGVYIDPQGEIDESLLIGFGEVATFAGSLFGIDYVYKQRYENKENYSINSKKPGREGSKRNDGSAAKGSSVPFSEPRER